MTTAAIAGNLAAQRCKGEPDFEMRILKAMRGAREFEWMLLDEGQLLAGALVGAMVESEGDERRQIERTLEIEKALAAATRGVPVDFAVLVGRFENLPKWPCRPIHELWEESAKP